MNQYLMAIMNSNVISPGTGDQLRPWIAALILIVSVIVLVAMIVLSKRPDSKDDSFQDEDESL